MGEGLAVQDDSRNTPTTLESAVAPKLPEKLQRAIEWHQSGHLTEARAAYEEILAVDPRHADAVNLLGTIAIQTSDFQHAVQLYAQAIEIDPTNLVAYCNSALALGALQQFEAALARYDQAIALKPDFAESHFNRGNVLWNLKRLDAGLASFRRALAIDPDYAEAYLGCGHVLRDLKQWEAARASYDQAIALAEDYEQAHFHRGNVLYELKQWEAALASYNRTIVLKPDFAEAYSNRGLVLSKLKQLDAALASFNYAIELTADFAEAYSNRALALYELKQWDATLASCDSAIALKPDHAEAHFNRGNALYELKQLDAALASYDRAIALKPDYAEAYSNRGIVFKELQQLDAALASCNQAIALKLDYAEAYSNRGNALYELKQWDAALASYNRAIALKPDYAEAHSNRGNALYELKQWDAALASYNRAIELKPDYAEAYSNRGIVLNDLRQPEAAVASCNQAIVLKPDYAAAYSNRGNALQALKQWEAALASYAQAIALKPDYAPAYRNRGHALQELKQWEAALASYARALELKPDQKWLYGYWLHTKMLLCDWQDVETAVPRLASEIERAERTASPFVVLPLTDSAALQRRAAELWVKETCPGSLALPPIARRARPPKIRLGYYSADFHFHPVTVLVAQLFEQHDRERFHVVAFSFGPDSQDEMRKRLSSAFDEFIDVRAKTPREIALLSRELEIDIAVDLMGFTQNSRSEIFAHRAAPIQVNYLGYPGTLGASYVDYIIADRVLIPEQSRHFYQEKVVSLPNSYQANDRSRRIADRQFSRAELGLPPLGFVFCCFNNAYKITPLVFDSWMRIMQRVEGSVLWLLKDSDTAANNLRREAQARGVSAERLIFAERMPSADHLARHRAAGLFLDTLPYNAHTTASDALWAGLPVLTRAGESFAARVAASLLNAVGLPELITTTAEQYEASAIALATDPERLAQVRNKLNGCRLTAPLFDSERFTRDLEQAYVRMHERFQQGLGPQDINIGPQAIPAP
jgi:protein O-GlcNAc transferase